MAKQKLIRCFKKCKKLDCVEEKSSSSTFWFSRTYFHSKKFPRLMWTYVVSTNTIYLYLSFYITITWVVYYHYHVNHFPLPALDSMPGQIRTILDWELGVCPLPNHHNWEKGKFLWYAFYHTSAFHPFISTTATLKISISLVCFDLLSDRKSIMWQITALPMLQPVSPLCTISMVLAVSLDNLCHHICLYCYKYLLDAQIYTLLHICNTHNYDIYIFQAFCLHHYFDHWTPGF